MTTPYYLYLHPNRHAPVRANGIRFWGHPDRQIPVRVIVVHTAENTPDYIGEDGGAEAVARYQATGVTAANASSYHEIGDSDSYVTMLPDEAVAFGARGANADGWHWSFATRAYLWPSKPDRWQTGALQIAAGRCRLRADAFGVPVRRLTRRQYREGASGFVGHGDVDPTRRTDPGPQFPWQRFLDLIRQPADDQEDEMKRGDNSDDVSKLQMRLNDVGADLVVDGDYGPKTEAAVLAFQQDQHLEVSGRASVMTVVHLQALAHGRGSRA